MTKYGYYLDCRECERKVFIDGLGHCRHINEVRSNKNAPQSKS